MLATSRVLKTVLSLFPRWSRTYLLNWHKLKKKNLLWVLLFNSYRKMSVVWKIPVVLIRLTSVSKFEVFHEAHERMLKASRIIVCNSPTYCYLWNASTFSGMVEDLFRDLSVQCKHVSSRRIGCVISRSFPIVV